MYSLAQEGRVAILLANSERLRDIQDANLNSWHVLAMDYSPFQYQRSIYWLLISKAHYRNLDHPGLDRNMLPPAY
ncbi:hypothetical protein FGO68_gene12409 [Halteria grandinella]|uniref:Uncharacterized protein n=1 Tax=Halteria grandinella TaxID=5974 RepID=A0A8J8T5U8_HALGN|nr:hypothetical protein FGO68_gene12409 [Halteria grandinella]